MIVSQAKLDANRANAKKSTGPRSCAGKNRSRMNGATHGIFCHDLVLSGEDPKLFEQFRHAILRDFSPQSMVELMLVDRIVSASWRLRRLHSAENLVHSAAAQELQKRAQEQAEDLLDEFDGADRTQPNTVQLAEPPAIAAMAGAFVDNSPTMERLSHYETRLDSMMHRAIRQLQKLRADARKRTQSGDKPVLRQCPFVPEVAEESESECPEESNTNGKTEPKVNLGGGLDSRSRNQGNDVARSDEVRELARETSNRRNPASHEVPEFATDSDDQYSGTQQNPREHHDEHANEHDNEHNRSANIRRKELV